MGILFLLELEQPNTVTDYFMCKQCRNHIALDDKFIDIYSENELHGILFSQAVNVQVDKPVHHRQLDAQTVADIYCVKCGDKLGWKYIQFAKEQIAARNGDIFINIRKLLKKERNQTVDAETIYQ